MWLRSEKREKLKLVEEIFRNLHVPLELRKRNRNMKQLGDHECSVRRCDDANDVINKCEMALLDIECWFESFPSKGT